METRFRALLLSGVGMLALSGCATLHWPGHHARAASPATAQPGAPAEAGGSDAATAAGGAPSAAESASGEVTPSSASAGSAADQDQGGVIQPQVRRRRVRVPKIRAENVELGASYGELSIQDFGTQPVKSLRLDYHITEDLFFEAAYGRAQADKTSYELLSGGVQLLSNAERRFTYYDLSLGYNMLPGEIFIGHNLAMTSALYMIGGIGSIDFAGSRNFSVNFGAGFRVLPTDWLALHIDVQDLVYRTNIFSVYRLTNNLQATIGASVFF